MSSRRAVLLDRDGVLNHEVSYVTRPEGIRIHDGVGPALLKLTPAGYSLIVVTNHSAVGRGLITESGLSDIHDALQRELVRHGAALDAIYYCPHHPEAALPAYRVSCECRKPRPGMLLKAAADWDLDLSRTFMVGDSMKDLQAAWSAGCRPVLVLTGNGAATRSALGPEGLARTAHVAPTLAKAAAWILRQDAD